MAHQANSETVDLYLSLLSGILFFHKAKVCLWKLMFDTRRLSIKAGFAFIKGLRENKMNIWTPFENGKKNRSIADFIYNPLEDFVQFVQCTINTPVLCWRDRKLHSE